MPSEGRCYFSFASVEGPVGNGEATVKILFGSEETIHLRISEIPVGCVWKSIPECGKPGESDCTKKSNTTAYEKTHGKNSWWDRNAP